MRFWRELDEYAVTGLDQSSDADDAHDPGAAAPLVLAVARSPAVLLQAGLKAVNLTARSTQAGDLEYGFRTEAKHGSERKREQVKPRCENVLANRARSEWEPLVGEFIKHFSRKQVNLAKIGLGRVLAHAVEVLRGASVVRVAFDTLSWKQTDERLWRLRKAVLRAQ